MGPSMLHQAPVLGCMLFAFSHYKLLYAVLFAVVTEVKM